MALLRNLLHPDGDEQDVAQSFISKLTAPDEKPPERRQISRIRGISSSFTLKGWFWEFTNLAMSFTSLTTIIAVLVRYRDRQTPQWEAGITLNAVVSLLATIFKGCLLMPVGSSISQFVWLRMRRRAVSLDTIAVYDRASRGPTGSLWFLGSRRILHLAVVGALLTLAATALDTFFQQTVQYELGMIADRSIIASTVGASGWNGTNGGVAEFSNADSLLPTEMRAAVYSGLYSYNAIAIEDPPYSCPTGNCTFAPFLTLAINSDCIDTTNMIKTTCKTASEIDLQDNPEAPDQCSLTAPDSGFLRTALNGTGSSLAMTASNELGYFTFSDPITKRWAEIPSIFSIVSWVRSRGGRGPANDTRPWSYITKSTKMESGVCAFHFGVHEMQAEVFNGRYDERILRRFYDMRSIDTGASNIVNVTRNDSNTVYFRQAWTTHEPIVWKPMTDAGIQVGSQLFSIAGDSFTALSSMIDGSGIFDGKVLYNQRPGAMGDGAALMLYNAESVPDLLKTMATYMTNALRANDTIMLQHQTKNASVIAPSQSVSGISYKPVQFVRVEWAWLSLPAVCLLIATAFTATAVMGSRSSGIGLWKDSPLTLLLNGRLDEHASEYVEGKRASRASAEGLEKVGMGLQATVTRSEDAIDAITISRLKG